MGKGCIRLIAPLHMAHRGENNNNSPKIYPPLSCRAPQASGIPAAPTISQRLFPGPRQYSLVGVALCFHSSFSSSPRLLGVGCILLPNSSSASFVLAIDLYGRASVQLVPLHVYAICPAPK